MGKIARRHKTNRSGGRPVARAFREKDLAVPTILRFIAIRMKKVAQNLLLLSLLLNRP